MINHKLFYGSSYDRGLIYLLKMWPKIKESVPDATLDICYGWVIFDKIAHDNPERQMWQAEMMKLMKQEGVTEHGRIGKEELRKVRQACGIWAHPATFREINCITALDVQSDGLVPVTMALGALAETACKGILIEGNIEEEEVQKKYLTELLALMRNEIKRQRMSVICKEFVRGYDWKNVGVSWIEAFKSPKYSTKCTVFTPTIRDGFWNIMAHNLAKQTHQNFEWLIVDGQDVSREEIAKKYAKKYNIDIKYVHQGKTKRTYGLCNANNIALEHATGELLVFLQDFVLMPPDGLAQLVRESNRHPKDFIAPCDMYFSPKVSPDQDNKEDWFKGNLDIMGEFMRANSRIQNKGLRMAREITDFEQNYGAVPVATLKALGGYYEFYDEALGWDNVDVIYRGKLLGYELWIDEHNIGICIDHHKTLGVDEGGKSVNRARRLNDPRFIWMKKKIERKELPIVRDAKIDNSTDLQYEIPSIVPDSDAVKWVRKNLDNVVNDWLK